MSRFKLFPGLGRELEDCVRLGENEPIILSFKAYARRYQGPSPGDVVRRARTLYNNRCCRRCGRAVVEPLDLDDALRNRNNLPVPGTSTLVGFFCHACDAEWAV